MPRETIRSSDYNFVPHPEGEDGAAPWDPAARLGVLEVGWSKAPQGLVELCTADETILHKLTEQVAAAAAQEDGDPARAVEEFFSNAGIWITLDRDGCNAAIRRLRQARDAAFGRDE